MPEPTWELSETGYQLNWGGRNWTLRLGDVPGLYSEDDTLAFSVLTLAGISFKGRHWREAFAAKHLSEVTLSGRTVQASYALPELGGLRVRARWSISAVDDAIDLEVEVAASSVGEIFDLEIAVRSQVLPAPLDLAPLWNAWVTPRDARTARFTYDGREPATLLSDATTLPIPQAERLAFLPRIFHPGTAAESARHYIEMVQPDDCSRRLILEPTGPGASRRFRMATCYQLFGHDLEKGVILRARLRGLWLNSETPDVQALAAYEQFLGEPLPLGP